MADVTERFAEQAVNTLLQIGNIAQANFVKMTQILDLSYVKDRNMVSLPEAVGVREVSSKEVPAGPNTVAAKV